MTSIIPSVTAQERSPAEYAKLRMSVGSQAQVARAIGVDISTLSRRENSDKPVSIEAVLCLKWFVLHPLQVQIDGKSDESNTNDCADQAVPAT